MKTDYDRVNECNKWKGWILIFSTIITIALTINEQYNGASESIIIKDYLDLIIGLNSILVLIYIVLDLRADHLYNKAEKLRRLQYIDNSFNTGFAGHSASNYFSQDNLIPGFYKLTVNCFENTFHTYHIVKLMQKSIYRNALLVLLVFMFSAVVGNKGAVRMIIEAILPLALVQNAIRTIIVVGRLETLLDSFKALFTTLTGTTFASREPEAIKQVIDYETTLAWASLPLDSKLFQVSQTQLATEWDALKSQYSII